MQKPLKLIVETQPSLAKTKSNSSGLPIILEGVFMEANKQNGNGRQYDLNSLITAANEFQPMIDSGRALSELEHPDTTTINPDRACARITSIKRNNNEFIGEALVLAADPARGIMGTPCGTLLASLLQYGTKVGWSSRGVGDIDNDNVVRDFHLVTIDCVLQPSTGHMASSNAAQYVDGILESADFVANRHDDTVLLFEALNKSVKTLPVDTTAKYERISTAVNTFLNSIKQL